MSNEELIKLEKENIADRIKEMTKEFTERGFLHVINGCCNSIKESIVRIKEMERKNDR